YLQSNEGRKVKIQEIADSYQISKNHLGVAVNKLSELKFVISTPGPKGGIEIDPQCKNKTLKDLVKKIENLDIVECFNAETNKCVLNPDCKLKHMLSKANQAFLRELSQYKVKDLV